VFSKRYHQKFVIIAANSNLAMITVTTMVVSNFPVGRATRAVLGTVEKFFLALQQGAKGLKTLTPNRKH